MERPFGRNLTGIGRHVRRYDGAILPGDSATVAEQVTRPAMA